MLFLFLALTLFPFVSIVAELPSCKKVVLQGVEPSDEGAYSRQLYWGWLRIFMGQAYTFQAEGYLIGWQMYNRYFSRTYYLDVFRPVEGASLTFDLVHSTAGASRAGNNTVLVTTPFKVQKGDYIGVHSDYVGTRGLVIYEYADSVNLTWPHVSWNISSHYFNTTSRIEAQYLRTNRMGVALRAIVAEVAETKDSCDQSFIRLAYPSTIITRLFHSEACDSESDCCLLCMANPPCIGFNYNTSDTCNLYLAAETLSTQPESVEEMFVHALN